MKKVLSILLALCLLLGALPMLASATGNAGLKDCGKLQGMNGEVQWDIMTDGTFYLNNYDHLENPEPVELGTPAGAGFAWTKYKNDIRYVLIGDGIKNIPGNAFNGCKNIQWIYISSGVEYAGHESFYGCTNIKTVHFAGSESDEGVTKIRSEIGFECPSAEFHYNCDMSDLKWDDPAPSTFSDVKADAYYADAVAWAVNNGITSGIGGGKFGPSNPCTREQIVTFLWNDAGKPAAGSAADFKDMPKNETYQKAISWAAEKSITSGYAGNIFRPGKTCTRAEAMTFIWRAHNCPEPSGIANLTDLPDIPDFRKAISWAYENNILAGDGKGHCLPDKNCTRAEIVSFLYRAKDL